jgi:hypothetical protein
MTASTLLLKMITIECIESVKYTINFNVETEKKGKKIYPLNIVFFST